MAYGHAERNLAQPGIGALVTLALIAAFALVAGVTQLTVAIGGKRLLGAPSTPPVTAA